MEEIYTRRIFIAETVNSDIHEWLRDKEMEWLEQDISLGEGAYSLNIFNDKADNSKQYLVISCYYYDSATDFWFEGEVYVQRIPEHQYREILNEYKDFIVNKK